MEVELTPGRRIGGRHPCYVIAELGQNHQGDENIAIELIRAAKAANCDCVKLQKSYARDKFTAAALARPYNSAHSFGPTYGDHKHALELTDEQFHYLQRFSHNESITFSASAMDTRSVDFLAHIGCPFIKIGSGDANNFHLIRHVVSKHLPVVYSTGMQPMHIISTAYDMLLANRNPALAVLHCVSSYPTPFDELNLHVIDTYRNRFTRAVIGYSGHELGLAPSLAAVALGAKVLERHITLDKTMKGNDHACSLEPAELRALVEQVRQIELSLGSPHKVRQPSEEPCYRKLGKSVVAARDLPVGTVITEHDLDVKVAEPPGVEAHLFDSLIGKKATTSIARDEAIQCNDVV